MAESNPLYVTCIVTAPIPTIVISAFETVATRTSEEYKIAQLATVTRVPSLSTAVASDENARTSSVS